MTNGGAVITVVTQGNGDTGDGYQNPKWYSVQSIRYSISS